MTLQTFRRIVNFYISCFDDIPWYVILFPHTSGFLAFMILVISANVDHQLPPKISLWMGYLAMILAFSLFCAGGVAMALKNKEMVRWSFRIPSVFISVLIALVGFGFVIWTVVMLYKKLIAGLV